MVTYEKVLEINPQAAVAANNLAYLYSEQGANPERALELAQRAKEIAPEDPSISDTLGWILYKRGLYQRALGLLQDSAQKLPGNAEVHYHLGMTLYQLQDRAGAERALSRALEINSGFPGADEAKQTLAEIG
jgi:tetratricopeptide (TPR) repeat protein